MNISKFFIDRPIFAGVLSVLILLAGIISLFKLPISEYPEVVPPSVVVHAQYPGANPKVIAEAVASPLEEQINGVENMLYMQSQANSDGNLTLTVTFKLGTNPDLATQLVQNRVNQALPRLPDVTRNLGVTTVKSSPDLTMVVHLRSPDKPGNMPLAVSLYNEALASSAAGGFDADGIGERSALFDGATRRALPAGSAASVIAPTCMEADLLTKVVLASGDPRHPMLAARNAQVAFLGTA